MRYTVLILAAVVGYYFIDGRERLRKVWPWLDRRATLDDALFWGLFNESRTLVSSRITSFAGYYIMTWDWLAPLLNKLVGAGLGEMLPHDAGRWIGLALIILGHLNTRLRQRTIAPLPVEKEKR